MSRMIDSLPYPDAALPVDYASAQIRAEKEKRAGFMAVVHAAERMEALAQQVPLMMLMGRPDERYDLALLIQHAQRELNALLLGAGLPPALKEGEQR